jgi:acyl carrier protein
VTVPSGYRKEVAVRSIVEARVRKVVAETLGVGPRELAPDVSLTDDLAADSLDMLELALALERQLGVVLPERFCEDVRTYRDLVQGTLTVTRLRRVAEAKRNTPAVWIGARVVFPDARARLVAHAGPLTPYLAERIRADALRGGPGTRLELTVRKGSAQEAWVTSQFAGLAERGVELCVVDVAAGSPAAA